MKFTATQSDLNDAIRSVARIVPSRPTHPVLGNILMRLQKNILTLTAFDLSLGIEISVEVQGEEDGAIAAPSDLLSEIISRIPSGEVTLHAQDDNQLQLKAGKGKYKTSWLNSEEFPELPAIENGQSVKLKAGDLQKAIASTIFCSSPEETKQMLTGVRLTVFADTLELAATDGHRLAVTKSEQKYSGEEIGVTIPARALGELEKLLKGAEEIEMVLNKSQVVFRSSDRKLTTRLLEGQYPAYRQLIPAQFSRIITTDRKGLLSAIERLAIFGVEKKNIKPVRLDVSGEEITLSVESSDKGSGDETIGCSLAGDDVLFALNIKYFCDALKAIQSQEVQLNLNNPEQPVVVTPVSGDKSLHLLMPILILN